MPLELLVIKWQSSIDIYLFIEFSSLSFERCIYSFKIVYSFNELK